MKRADEKTIVNIRAEQFEDIEDPIILHVSQYEKINGDYQNLANSSLDVCNIVSRVKTHPLLKLIIKELLKSSNFQTSCPLRKVRRQHITLITFSSYVFFFREFTTWKTFLWMKSSFHHSSLSEASCQRSACLGQSMAKNCRSSRWHYTSTSTTRRSAKATNYSKKLRFLWKRQSVDDSGGIKTWNIERIFYKQIS